MNMMQDVHMHGAGNRFLIHFGSMPPATLCQELNGADGVLVVAEDENGIHMRIFNADGNEAEQCGNGLRCVALHLVRSRVVSGSKVEIQTAAGVCSCVVHEDRNEVEVALCVPECGLDHCSVDVDQFSTLPALTFVNVGNPNAVLWTEKDPIEVRDRVGKDLSNHSAFTQGMNIHVARRDDDHHATVASWERGVGPTLASGTGGAAVFVAANADGPFYVSSLGGTLSYRYDDKGTIVKTGPAGYV
jgi:diaminopimelate epimerase